MKKKPNKATSIPPDATHVLHGLYYKRGPRGMWFYWAMAHGIRAEDLLGDAAVTDIYYPAIAEPEGTDDHLPTI